MGIEKYIQVTSISEVLSCLGGTSPARIICGGTDMVISLREGSLGEHITLVDISRVKELQQITQDGQDIEIGAAAVMADIAESSCIAESSLILHHAARSVGSPQIRSRGTIGGNIVTSAQCADTIPALLALDAQITLMNSEQSVRTLPISQFLTGPKQTDIRNDELLISVRFPSLAGGVYRGSYYKLIRRAAVAKSRMSFALISAQDRQGIVEDIRISIGSALSTHGRFKEAEKMLIGKKASLDAVEKTAECCVSQVVEQTGIRWSSAYKLPVIKDVLCRELETLLEMED